MMKTKAVSEILKAFVLDPKIGKSKYKNTRQALNHASRAMGFKSLLQFPAEKLREARKPLSRYLDGLRISLNTRRTYQSSYTQFIHWCQEKRYLPIILKRILSQSWANLTYPLPDVSPGRRGNRDALRKLGYLCTMKEIEPHELQPAQLCDYLNFLKNESGIDAWPQIYHRTRREWQHHERNGDLHHLDWPSLPTSTRSGYSLKLEFWPVQMRKIYQEYREWSTDDLRPNRPRQYKQRESSANQNLSTLERMAGFAHNIQGTLIKDLNFDLFFDQSFVYAYIQWLIKHRFNGKRTVTLERIVAQLLGMANGFFQPNNHAEWLLPLKKEVSGAPVRDKKQMALSVGELNAISDGIHDQRIKEKAKAKAAGREPGKKRQARLFMFELMMRLCIKRLLRRKNLCEIRIGSNLIDKGDHHYILRFEPEEMKGGKEYVSYFPTSLIPLLEEYLELHRPHLLDGFESDYLFPAHREKHISGSSALNFFRRHSLRIVGKPLSPHLVRHSVAIEFLIKHPGEYLTLSVVLQHSDVKITIDQDTHFDSHVAAEIFDKMMEEDENQEKANYEEEI